MKRAAFLLLIISSLAFTGALYAQDTREVRLGSFLLLRIRCASGGYSINERVYALQLRANDLLKAGKEDTKFSVKKQGQDAVIFADNSVFITVGPCDAKANGTTPEKLAKIWAQRLRDLLPKATPNKPGVGRSQQP